MTVKEQLQAARRLIENPENWIQGAFKDESGRMCASGAIREVTGTITFSDHTQTEAYQALEKFTGGLRSVSNFNDNHTHAEVLAAFDRAIEAA